MSHRTRSSQPDHISDLLPAYINGTLDQETSMRVHAHLGSCAACRDELAEWEDIASATRAFAVTLQAPEAQGLADQPSISNQPQGQREPIWHAHDPVVAYRPASRRTLRTGEEKRAMQVALSTPYRRTRWHQSSRKYVMVAATLAILLGIGGIALLNGSDRNDDGIRLPAAMQLNPEASPEGACRPDEGAMDRLALTGQTTHETLVMLPPPGPTEGRPGIEASMLPTGGEPIDEDTQTGVAQTVEGLVRCMNANSPEGTVGWTSDDYWRRTNEIGVSINPEKPRSFVPLVGPASSDTPMPILEDARIFDDGRVGAIIRPGFDVPAYSFDYYVFVENDGRWLIDEAVHVTAWTSIEVVVTDEGFMPTEIVAPAAPAKLVVRNEGTAPHSFVVSDLLIRIEIAPGESETTNLKHPGGSFGFHSDIAGDDPDMFSGMLVIEGEQQATPAAAVAQPESQPVDVLGVPVASVTITMLPPGAFQPNRVSILADRDVEITLVNDPSASNTGADFLTPVAEGGFEGSSANFTIDALGISVDLSPGETRTIVVNAPAGVYAYYSTIPGHTEVGMSGTLHVVEEATPAP